MTEASMLEVLDAYAFKLGENRALKETVRHLVQLANKPLLLKLAEGEHEATKCNICTRAASYIRPNIDVSWWRW